MMSWSHLSFNAVVPTFVSNSLAFPEFPVGSVGTDMCINDL